MKQFAKSKFIKEILEVYLFNHVPCTESNNYFVFSFITKKQCTQITKCKLKMGPYSCCSKDYDTVSLYEDLPEGYTVETINGSKYLIVEYKTDCFGRACCEERLHYICNPNQITVGSSWSLSYKDKVTYYGTDCDPYLNSPGCNIEYPNTCKSGCNEN